MILHIRVWESSSTPDFFCTPAHPTIPLLLGFRAEHHFPANWQIFFFSELEIEDRCCIFTAFCKKKQPEKCFMAVEEEQRHVSEIQTNRF